MVVRAEPPINVVANTNFVFVSEDWKHRHAGIMALSTIGEGCKRQMEPHITQVITDFILPATDDPVSKFQNFYK